MIINWLNFNPAKKYYVYHLNIINLMNIFCLRTKSIRVDEIVDIIIPIFPLPKLKTLQQVSISNNPVKP